MPESHRLRARRSRGGSAGDLCRVDPGLTSVKRYYEAFWSAFPDAKVKADDVMEQGNKVALRFLITGTHLGRFLTLAPTGRSVSFAGMTMLHFDSGKCVERWSVNDSITMFDQLRGVAP